jgi:hypothetical protein
MLAEGSLLVRLQDYWSQHVHCTSHEYNHSIWRQDATEDDPQNKERLPCLCNLNQILRFRLHAAVRFFSSKNSDLHWVQYTCLVLLLSRSTTNFLRRNGGSCKACAWMPVTLHARANYNGRGQRALLKISGGIEQAVFWHKSPSCCRLNEYSTVLHSRPTLHFPH